MDKKDLIKKNTDEEENDMNFLIALIFGYVIICAIVVIVMITIAV